MKSVVDGSTCLVLPVGGTTDANGAKVSEMRYKPWGEVRSWWTASLSTTPAYKLADYTFTGQFSYMDDPSTSSVTEGFGLMFYVSRMYDPALGRFIQADSIVGGDRYAYVNNSPVNYTDPSGHVCTDPDDLWSPGCEGGGSYPSNATPLPSGATSPSYIDPDQLSKVKGEKTDASGNDLYSLYLQLWDDKNAWYWNDGDFTIWDFITLIFYREAWTIMGSPDNTYTAYQEAWARSFHTWCSVNSSICSGASNPASVLNYLAVASESAGRMVANSADAKTPLRDWKGDVVPLSSASPIVAGLSNSTWSHGCVGDRPCYVGNWSLFSADMAKAASAWPWFFNVWGEGNSVVIMTLCQSFYWEGGYWAKDGRAKYRVDYPNCQLP